MSSLIRATGIVFFLNLLSKILGFVRDAALASLYGASSATDAYLIAYTLPFSLQNVFGMSFLLVMVPFLTRYFSEGRSKEALGIARGVAIRLILFLSFVRLAEEMLAVPLVRMLAPGFTNETLLLSAGLTRIMLPSIVFMGAAMLFSGMLNAKKHFALAAFGPALANLVAILGILLTARTLGIHGAALATLAGFFFFFLLLWYGVRRKGFVLLSGEAYDRQEARSVLLAILPVTLSISINQVFLMVSRGFGSALASGTIAALEFAGRIINLPLGVYTAAVVTASYPLLAQTALSGDRKALSDNLMKTMRLILWIMIPAAMGIVALREPLIRLLFERGAFDLQATKMTADVLVYYAWGMVAMSLNLVLTRAYFAVSNYRGPVLAGLASVLFQVVLSLVLVEKFALPGLALVYALANACFAALLLVGYRKYLKTVCLRKELIHALWFFFSSVIMGWAVLSLRGFLENRFAPGAGGTALLIMVCGALGLLIYFSALAVLGHEEQKGYFVIGRNRKDKYVR